MTKLDDSVSKSALRAELKRAREGLPLTEWNERSRAVVEHVERFLENHAASRVALYAPIEVRREVDVRSLDTWLRSRGADVAYPVMRDGTAGFAWLPAAATLTTLSAFPQPDASCEALAPGELEIIIVPALAATPAGYRLGYGSGFYDRVLSRFSPPATSICVVFESQLRSQLPIAPHDIPCHVVITERGIRDRRIPDALHSVSASPPSSD